MPDPNDPSLRSFIAVEATSDFPDPEPALRRVLDGGDAGARVGVAIGDYVLDLWELEQDCRLDVASSRLFGALAQSLHGAGAKVWSQTRARISALLRHDSLSCAIMTSCAPVRWCRWRNAKLHFPIAVSGYTDFYSSKEHATNVGVNVPQQDNALQPNWLHMPIGYNGRASTVVVSGTRVRRPRGQLKPPNADAPTFGPCRRLDFRIGNGRRDRAAVVDGRRC